MQELWRNLMAIDFYTQVVVFCSVATAIYFVRTMTDSTSLTVIFTPAILFGALAANYLFRANFIMASNDKDTNVVVASAVGVLLALILMLLAARMTIYMSDRRRTSMAGQPMALPPINPDSPQN